MINNRQGGRRRGRGGQRPQGMAGNAGGNRQDNRQRGNAAQLLEKYKSLARDAQLAGDRVQTEYYLQYADHYFRVLEETRSRFEEQQSHRRRRDEDEDDMDGETGEELGADSDGDEDDGDVEVRARPNRERSPNRDRSSTERGDRGQRADRADRADRVERQDRRDRYEPRANGAARADEPDDGAHDERISLGVLPPAIGAGDEGSAEEVAAKPRRRTRKPKTEDGDAEDIAPAA